MLRINEKIEKFPQLEQYTFPVAVDVPAVAVIPNVPEPAVRVQYAVAEPPELILAFAPNIFPPPVQFETGDIATPAGVVKVTADTVATPLPSFFRTKEITPPLAAHEVEGSIDKATVVLEVNTPVM